MKKHGVRGYPTVLFLKPNEEEIERLGRRDPESVKAQMVRIYDEYAQEAAAVTWAESVDEALEMASDADGTKLVFIFFYNDKKRSKFMEKITMDNLHVLKALGERYVAVKIELDRKSDLAKKCKVSSAPAMVVLDREGNKLEVARGSKKPKDAIRFLDKAWKSYEKESRKKGAF
jgi:thioredoxin-related protein